MRGYADWMAQLIDSLVKLPGIGRRSAERIVFHLLKTNRPEVAKLATLLTAVKDNIFFCETCHPAVSVCKIRPALTLSEKAI